MKRGKTVIQQPSIAIVNAYTIIAAVYCVSFSAIFYSVVGNIFLAIVHLLALISVIVNYFILRVSRNFQRATNIILTTGTCVVISLFATGGWDNTGFLWPFAYLPFAFFLTDKRVTIYWVLALFTGCILITILPFFKIISLPYSSTALFNYFAALLIFILCMYFFQKATINYEEFLSYTSSLLEASIDPFFTIDGNGKIADSNLIAEKITGVAREKLIGSYFADYFTEPVKAREICMQVFSGSHAYNFPLSLRNVAGHVTEVLLNATLYRDERAKVNRVFATARSIAEQKRIENDLRQSEEQIQTIFNAAPDPVIVIDEDGRIVKWNPKAEVLFGWTQQEALGKSLNDTIIPQRYHEAHKKGLAHFLETGEGPILGKTIEIVALNKNKKEFDVALSISPTRIKNKYFFIGFIRNITEQKKAEEKRVTLLNELEKMNKELETFSYSVSHDLKAPLRAINNFSQLLLRNYSDKLDKESLRPLKIINESAEKMGQLIDDLLNFSRMGKKEMDIYFVDMNELITPLIEEQLQLNAHSLEITTDKLENCYCDSSLLRQVWANLISNAVKYSIPREKQLIKIGSSKKGNEIIYSIKDNGVGFDMKYAPKLFQVFQRLHSDEKFEGSGIGLALVERIIAKHGGRVWAEGKIDEGAVFYFSIPAHVSEK